MVVGPARGLRAARRALLLALVLVLAAIRFVDLEADFPTWSDIDWSGDLYTDEGWYTRNAARQVRGDDWFQEGDHNPAVNLPVFPLIQVPVFWTLGVSLGVARGLVLASGLLVVGLTSCLVRVFVSPAAAWWGAVLLLSNFFFFAFGRLSLWDIPMTLFALSSIALVLRRTWPTRDAWVAAAGLALSLAILTKTSGVFAVAVALALIWSQNAEPRLRVRHSLLLLTVIAACLTIHLGLVARRYSEVYVYFSRDVYGRLQTGIGQGVWDALLRGRVVDRVLYGLGWGGGIALLASPRLRRHPIVVAALSWLVAFTVVVGVNGYAPPRYYQAVTVPVVMIVAILLDETLHRSRGLALKMLVGGLAIASVMLNTGRIVRTLWMPAHSFRAMALSVSRQVREDGDARPVLLGDLADSISLVGGVPAVNVRLGPRGLRYKLERYRPTHFVSIGPGKADTIEVLAGRYRVELIGRYDVFGNYYTGDGVYLYRLRRFRPGGEP